jgi:hypothetical protein
MGGRIAEVEDEIGLVQEFIVASIKLRFLV